MDFGKELEKHTTSKILVGDYEIDTVRKFLDYLGKPDEGMTIFHVGGTSGKGSTSTLLSSILSAHGLKTGLFVSPHIESVRERIQIKNECISEGQLEKCLETVFVEFKKFSAGTSVRDLTYFEILLVAAMLHFRENGVKHAVIEVGLGGKLDPTNALFGKYCILTNVGLDHQKVLGDTVEEISRDKVQIVKNGAKLITGVIQPSVKEIVNDWVAKVGAGILSLDKEFEVKNVRVDLEGTKFEYYLGSSRLASLQTNLVGVHQATNAALAITAFLEFARDTGLDWEIEKINAALKVKNFPGRFEIRSKEPLVIWDGAHNGDKMKALFEALEVIKCHRKLRILLAIKNDKDIKSIVDAIKPIEHDILKIVLTDYHVKQDVEVFSTRASRVKKILKQEMKNVEVSSVSNAKQAYQVLMRETKKDEILLVTGSFYLLSQLSG